MDLNPHPVEKSCSICGRSFHCGCQCTDCWCAGYPAILPVDFSRDCQCPTCLAQNIGKYLDEHLQSLDLEDALALTKPFSRSKRLIESIDYHVENNLWIFSRWYLLKRGHCCGEACKHCPYRGGEDRIERGFLVE